MKSFLLDDQTQLAQEIQQQTMTMQQTIAFREDVRDLRHLEAEMGSTQITLGGLLLAAAVAIYVEGYPPPEASNSFSGYMWTISICLR